MSRDVVPYKDGGEYLRQNTQIVPKDFRRECERCRRLPAFQGIIKRASGLCTLCLAKEQEWFHE